MRAGPTYINDQAERVAQAMIALETAPILGFAVTPMTDLGRRGVNTVVALRIAGVTHWLAPDDARLLARCLEWDGGGRENALLASLFESAACDAEAMQAKLARHAPGLAAHGGAAAGAGAGDAA